MKSAFGLDGHDPAERDPNYYDAGKSHEQPNRVVHFLLRAALLGYVGS